MLEGEKTVSLAADLKATFSISLHKDAGSSEPITSSNLKLGEVFFRYHGHGVAGVVETKRYGLKLF